MKYLKLKLNAPKFFTGKIINHNGFEIEYNKNYIGEQLQDFVSAIKEIENSTRDRNNTPFFKASIIEDNIDLSRLPLCNRTDDDSKLLFNLKELGFKLDCKGPMSDWQLDNPMQSYLWNFRISKKNTQTLENIRNS